MAKKELWDDLTTIKEFYEAFNYLDNIPKKYLKLISRALHLHIYADRINLQSVRDAGELREIQGGITAIARVLLRIDAILDGTATRLDPEAHIKLVEERQSARDQYRELFEGEGDADEPADEYFEG